MMAMREALSNEGGYTVLEPFNQICSLYVRICTVLLIVFFQFEV